MAAEQQASREKARADAAERAKEEAGENRRRAERAAKAAKAEAAEAAEAAEVAEATLVAGRADEPGDPFPQSRPRSHGGVGGANGANGSSIPRRATSAAQRRLQRSAERCTPRSEAACSSSGGGGGGGGGASANHSPGARGGGGGAGGGGSRGAGGASDGDDWVQLHALAQFGRSQVSAMEEELHRLDPSSSWSQEGGFEGGGMMYEVTIPPGVTPGMTFAANVGGVLMSITCPEGCSGAIGQGSVGDVVQVRGLARRHRVSRGYLR